MDWKCYKIGIFSIKTNPELSKLIFAPLRVSYLVDMMILFYFTLKNVGYIHVHKDYWFIKGQ